VLETVHYINTLQVCNCLSVHSPAVDEERMGPDLAFSALTLTVGHKKDIQSIKYCSPNAQRLSSGTGEGGPEGNRLSHVHLQKWLLKGSTTV